MRTKKMQILADQYQHGTSTTRIQVIRKVWGSDGLEGLETLSWLVSESIQQLAAEATITRAVARAKQRREWSEMHPTPRRLPRPSMPRGTRADARAIAIEAAQGRRFAPPKRHWDPLH